MLVWASDLQANEQVRQRVVQQGIAFLVSKGQSEDGSFSAAVGPAVTALSATAMMKNGRTVEDPSVAKALKYLDGFVVPQFLESLVPLFNPFLDVGPKFFGNGLFDIEANRILGA